MAVRRSSVSAARDLVTAVLVVHDGEPWLPSALEALSGQSRSPDRLVAVDTGSVDASPDILIQALGARAVHTAPPNTGFGAAVGVGLAAVDGKRGHRPSGATEWIWLLHDDCSPAPDALEALLAYARAHSDAAIIGPKVRDWDDPRVLLEVGLTTDRAGHRYTGLERGEIDQGQHDQLTDVLAVGSPGSLIRRDVWEELHGYDANLPLFRDDLDFGWRAVRAGHRVCVATEAVVYHAQAGARGLRQLPAAAGPPQRVDRRNALYVVLVNATLAGALFGSVRLALGTAWRSLLFLITRRPRRAFDEAWAYFAVLWQLPRMTKARLVRRPLRRVPAAALRALFPRPGARVRAVLDQFGDRHRGLHAPALVAPDGPLDPQAPSSVASERSTVFERDADSGSETGPVSEEAEVLAVHRIRWRAILGHPRAIVVLLLTAVALIAERRLLGSGQLLGGRLLPAPGGASELWHTYTETWHPVGTGSTAAAPPYVLLLAVLSTLCLGKAWLAVDLLLLGAVPLAGVAAYAALRPIARHQVVRAWSAVTYGLLPVGAAAVGGGRLGVVVSFIVLPLLLSAGGRAVYDVRRGAGWRHAWTAGLLLAIIAAFSPELYPWALLAMLAGVIVATTGSRPWLAALIGAGRGATAVLIAGAVPIALLAPWSWRMASGSRAWVLGTGYLTGAAERPETAPWRLLLGHAGGPGGGMVWPAVPLLVAAVAVTIPRRDKVGGAGMRAGLVALLAVAAGLAGAVTTAAATRELASGARVAGWPGASCALCGAGLIAAAALAAAGARTRLSGHSFGWRQLVAVMLAGTAALVPAVVAVGWMVRGTPGPLHNASVSDVLPPFVADDLADTPGARVLVLRPLDGAARVTYGLADRSMISLSTADLAPDGASAAEFGRAVHDLVGVPSDAAVRLRRLAVRFVILAGTPDPSLVAALDGQPGLVRSLAASPVVVWQLQPGGSAILDPVAAALALDPGGQSRASSGPGAPSSILGASPIIRSEQLDSGPSGRLLVLPVASAKPWHAQVDGKELAPRTAWGWAQAFELPAGGGQLTVWLDGSGRRSLLWSQLAMLAVVLVLAAPSVRADQVARPGRRAGHLAPPAGSPRTPSDGDAEDSDQADGESVAAKGEQAQPGTPSLGRRA